MSDTHKAEHVDTQAGAHFIAYCYRCCGDPRTDSWITIYDPHTYPDAAIDGLCSDHASGRELRHAAKLAAEAFLDEQTQSPQLLQTTDLAGGVHHLEVVRHEHAADEILKVFYLCCGKHRYEVFIDRLHENKDLTAVLASNMAEAARGCANADASRRLSTRVPLTTGV